MNWHDRLYQIQKSTGKDTHHKLFKKVKNEADCMTKSAYYKYRHGHVGIIDMTPDTSSSRHTLKRFFCFLKNWKQDSQSSSPLKKDEQLCTDNVQTTDLLNCQFQLVFTPKSPHPLTFKQLCQQKVQALQKSGHYNQENVLPEAVNNYTNMAYINISVHCIMKLLQCLKPDKAPDPDPIKPLSLNKLHSEVAAILQVIFFK